MKTGNSQGRFCTILKFLAISGLLCAAATGSAGEYPPNYNPDSFGQAMAVVNDGSGDYVSLEIECIDSKGHIIAESSSTIPKAAELRTHFPWINESNLRFDVSLNGEAIGTNIEKGQYSLCKGDGSSAAGEKTRPLLKEGSELYVKYCTKLDKLVHNARKPS